MNVNDYQNEFDKILSRKYFPERLINSRKKAFSKFLDIGIPSRKWEDWRHTDLSFLNKNDFRISETNDLSKNIDIAKYKIKNTSIIPSEGINITKKIKTEEIGKEYWRISIILSLLFFAFEILLIKFIKI